MKEDALGCEGTDGGGNKRCKHRIYGGDGRGGNGIAEQATDPTDPYADRTSMVNSSLAQGPTTSIQSN